MTTVYFSMVNSRNETQAISTELAWDDFVTLLQDYSTVKRTPEDKEAGTVPAIISARFAEGHTSKSKENVVSGANWIGLDVDDINLEQQADFESQLKSWRAPYVLYTTTKHMPVKPRLRALVMLDRVVTAEEHVKLWHLFNGTLADVLDISTHNVNRLHYVPAAWTSSRGQRFEAYNGEGFRPFRVDQALRLADDAIADGTIKLPGVVSDADLLALLNGLTNKAAQWTSFRDCKYVTNDMLDEYRNGGEGGRFFKLMTRIAARALRDRYNITADQLAALAVAVDVTMPNSKSRKTALQEAARALYWAQTTVAAHPSDREQLLTTYESGLTFNYNAAACGEGKTHHHLARILGSDTNVIWSSLKIDDMRQRELELAELAPGGNHGFTILKVASKRSADSEDEATTINVLEQLKKAEQRIRSEPNKRYLIQITHAANQLMDWSNWTDLNFELIEDEVREVIKIRKPNYKKNFAKIRALFSIAEEDVGCYRLGATPQCEKDYREDSFDDLDRMLKYYAAAALSLNIEMWVTKESWDNGDSKPLEFIFINKPHNLRAFKRVTFLGDEFAKSPLSHIWSAKYGVQWQLDADFKPGQVRAKPLGQRMHIHYFSNDRTASKNWYEQGTKTPLLAISSWIKQNFSRVLWTANEENKDFVKLERRGDDEDGKHARRDKYLTPRAHGQNGWQDYNVCFWGCALRLTREEKDLLRRCFGIDPALMQEWREHNSMNQFIMRGSARRYADEGRVDVICVDHMQIAYLRRRYDIPESNIHHHPNVINDILDRGGRPLAEDNPLGRALTQTERNERFKAKEEAARIGAGLPKRGRGRPRKIQPEAAATP